MTYALTGDLRVEAMSLYVSGQSCRAVAAAMGVTYHCIRDTALAAGVLRGRGTTPLSEETKAQVLHLYSYRTITVEEVARRAGVAVSTVHALVRKAGLPRRIQPRK